MRAKPSSPELTAAKKLLLEQRLQGVRQQQQQNRSIPRRAVRERAPLSFAQRRLYFLDQWEPNSPMYNMPTAIRVMGALNFPALEKAFTALINRHEILRTRFVAADGEPIQEIYTAPDFKIPIHDLSSRSADQRKSELDRWLQSEARHSFNLSQDVLIRCSACRLGADDQMLMINMHHIASDAWSFGVLFEELSAYYNGFLKGEPVTLPELPIQYADYAAWQRAMLDGKAQEQHLKYWRQKLAGAPDLLEFPADHARPAAQTFRGKHQTWCFPAALAATLNKVAQQARVTPFMLLLAVFKVLLQKYCRQDDIVVGSPIAGRTQVETEKLIGFFINTLVLRTDLAANPTFLELLERVRTTTLEAYAHQELPFERLVEELKPERTPSYSPLVQAMFVLHTTPQRDLKLGEARLEFIDVNTATAKFDFILSMAQGPNGLEADLEFNADLFEENSMARLLRHYQNLLEVIAADPKQRLSELAVLGEAEKRQLLIEWNQTQREYPRNASIPEIFEAQVKRASDAVALCDGSKTLTYAALNARANQFAHYLQRAGVRTGTPVAVFLDRGAEMIVAFLGILKAGGAYVPLDRSYPKDRMAFMLADTKAPLIVTQQDLLEQLPKTTGKVVCVDRDAKTLAAESDANPESRISGESLAYVIYTSGSTGRPKGVLIPHRGITRMAINADYLQLDRNDVVAQVSNCSFDAATWEIWAPLLNGSRLVIVPPEALLAPQNFSELLEKQSVRTLFITTALLHQFAAEYPAMFGNLKHLLTGGEALDAKWVREIFQKGRPQRFLNMYGPTECSTYATWHPITEPPDASDNIPIGRPITNTEAYIVDAHLRLCPVGVPGELLLGGDGLALGYLDRPELTAEKFVRHPFSSDPKAQLYRTGDLVRYLPSGAIQFLGRIDHQVKIRGFRVELGEIENVLSQHEQVRQCTVTVRTDSAGAKQLVAYYSSRGNGALTTNQLKEFLQIRLPAYMVPTFLVAMPELPLTPNGKIDRRALPAPELSVSTDQAKYAPPRNQIETDLQEIWQTVLGASPIGIRDKFFELGGHSLLALRLIAQIEKKFGRKLSVTTIFQRPTIEQLALVLADKEVARPATSLVEIQPNGHRPPLVLVHGVGGGMFWGYSNLARHLGNDQPIYAIKSRGLDGIPEFETIEEMADAYIKDLRAFQPQGPYYLGGYCFGGNVAYEMSRRLVAAGEKVALLVLLNSNPPNSSYTRIRFGPRFVWRFLLNLWHWSSGALQWNPQQRRDYFRWKGRLWLRTISRLFTSAGAQSPEQVDDWVDISTYPEDQRRLWETHIRALMNYHPRPFEGHVTLFRSRVHHLLSSYDPEYGWGDLAQDGVSVHIVPGAHEKIIDEPEVQILAAQLKKVLAAAQTCGGPTPSAKKVSEKPTAEEIALSPGQQQLWFSLPPPATNPAHLLSEAYRIHGPLDVTALNRSFDEIIRRHEPLRANFLQRQGQPAQIISLPPRFELKRVSLDASQAADLQRILAPETEQPFDLERERLLRATLFEAAANEFILRITAHKLVCDEFSLNLLCRELESYYELFSHGKEISLADLPMRYRDFVQQSPGLAPELSDEERLKLADETPGLDLPMANPPSGAGPLTTQAVSVTVSQHVCERLKRVSANEEITLFLVLLAATGALLYRYTRQETFGIHAFINERTRAEFRNLIGWFGQWVLVRLNLVGTLNFTQLLHRTQTAFEESRRSGCWAAHAELLASLSPCQVGFCLAAETMRSLQLASLSAEKLPARSHVSQFPLTFAFTETAEGLRLELHYTPSVFKTSTVQRLAAHMATLLESIAQDPATEVGRLRLLALDEQKKVLTNWSQAPENFPLDANYWQLFARQVRETPDAIAVRHGNAELTYAQLEKRATHLACALAAQRVTPEQTVAVALDRSLDLAVGILGIMKAGGVYLPLELSLPKERITFLLSDSKARVILTRCSLKPRLPDTDAQVLCLEDIPEVEGNVQVSVKSENLAYIMYTSGSTGTPKGVQITHRSLINHNCAVIKAFGLTPSDRVLQFASLSFDISIEELFPAWLCGATVVFRPDEVLGPVNGFLDFVRKENITVLDLPTAYWHELVDACKGRTFPECVRLVVIGGEQASFQHWKTWSTQIRHSARLINTYGPTEATVTATLYEGEFTADSDAFPIGRPIANSRAYVLDQKLQLAPIGVPGELHVGGLGVARGYVNRPELTAEKFIADPFAADGESRLYKTGDLVRWREDGALEFLGRVDDQVKIRGYRIEPGEIESAILQHPAIKQAAVVARGNSQRERRLAAYYVAGEDQFVTRAELLKHLQAKLPDYMVPAALCRLETLPLTPSGKLDRRALPEPEFVRPELDQPYVPPQTDAEKQISKIWCEVLGLDRVGLHDNFFSLGGHSLHAMQMISRVQAQLKTDAPVADFFAEPTLAAFVASLSRTAADPSTKSKVPAISRAARSADVPLSYAQQRLWFLDQLHPHNPVYNLPQPIRLRGRVNFGALERALNELVQRHESLRTNFVSVMGTPIQKIAPSAHLRLQFVDLSSLSEPARETELPRVLQAEAQKAFDLQRDLMIRALLVKVDAEESVLLLTMHHIVSDAWSIGQLLEELALVYEAFVRNEASPLSELPVQYADFALWQREWLQQGTLAEQLGYWKTQLAGVPSLFEWPADHPRPALETHRGGNFRFSIPPELSARLRTLAQQEGCTLFMTLLAGFQALAHRYTGREDIVTGSVIANRNRPEVEPLIGFFVNTLALRTKIEGKLSFRELLHRVRKVTLEAYANQDLPFEKLVEEVQPERDTSFQPLIQTMLVLQNVPMPDIPGSELSWVPFELDVGYSRFDLTIDINETPQGLAGRIEYARDLFEPDTIERLAAHFRILLQNAAEDPDAPIARLEVLPATEKTKLVQEWNRTALPFPQERCLHELFEDQAAKTPAATALCYQGESLTYSDLDRRADTLARHLQTRGIGPESPVAICHERTPELIVGILAILKAGAAYVPIDPVYPRERLDFVLNDSGARLLLTQKKLADRFHGRTIDTVYLDALAASNNPPLARNGNPANTAYVIFTSGSTGRPKGVVVEHRSAVNLVYWAKEVFTPDELDGVLAATSVCFDLSVFEIFVPLCLGGKIILANNALELPALPAANQVRLVNTVPSALAQLLELNGLPDSVSVVNLAGEPLTRQLVDRIYQKPTVRKVYDLYGPTEDTVYATFALRKPGEPPTIGRPLANNQIYILSPERQLVPQGAAGELYIGGDGLARGYLNRPDLTSERFVPDPFSGRPGARLYRTGDLARYRADGNIEFLGRIDQQVKIRGYRIELGEIEENLRQHPLVRDAVVMAREDRSGDKRLAAYVIARNSSHFAPADVQRFLQQRLPDYMVPAFVLIMDHLPLTPNGKVDRKALPEPDPNARNPEVTYVEPSTDLEKLLAEIWREVLEIERVGVHDNFFKLGGHSLKVTQVISRLREAIQLELPMRVVFEAPTIASLGAVIEELLIKEIDQLSEEEAQNLNRELEGTV